jgi:glycine/D-amino acid oxidase-like deaminating enzyme
MKNYPYLIVGQGLAGTLLAHQLLNRGVAFKIIDTGINNSSRIAAGVINPIVFRRTTKSWLVDECLPVAVQTFRELEQKLQTKFLFERKVRRAFSSEQERQEWEQKAKLDTYSSYLSLLSEGEKATAYFRQTYGNALVKEAYYVDATCFLEANRKYFIENKLLMKGKIEYSKIQRGVFVYENETFEQILFCEGYEGRNNPFFSDLPLTQTKGQLITVRLFENISKSEILNRKCFFLPLENGLFKVGATYEWDNPTLNTTLQAKEELTQHLKNLIDLPFEIVEQEAGVRPTVTDRRPLIGKHHTFSNLFIFNGFGAKGYLLAPYFANEFVAFLLEQKALNREVSIDRFYNKSKKV